MARPVYYALLVQGFVAGCLATYLLQQQRRQPTAERATGAEDKPSAPGAGAGAGARTGAGAGADATASPGRDFDQLCQDLPPLTEDQKEALVATAQALATRGRGILAADESTPTVRKVF